MNIRSSTRLLRALAFLGFAAAVSPLAAQTTTSALAGQIDSDKGGPIAGATVVVLNVPTNTSYSTTTNEAGRFVFGGLNVGGPYEVAVSAAGYRSTAQKGIYLELSKTYRVSLVLASSDVVELEEFVVESTTTTIFDTDAIGTGSVIGADQISTTANVRRAISDFARLNPLVTLGDSDRLEINAAGQHYRQNSIQVDGVNINDQFGLEASGLPSLNNPISINTIAQFNVEISPYDVRQSGFTGAAINAVTRSGSNQFSGELYYYFSGDNIRGENVNTGRKDPYDEKTYGLVISGPILKDRLFFFYNYENFEKTLAASNPNFIPSAASVAAIQARMSALGYDVGTYGGGSAQEVDDKHFVKIDAVISSAHRLSARYAETIASAPNFGRFSDSGQSSLSSGFYSNDFKTTSYGLQAFSRWSDRFETEISVARDNFDKVPTASSAEPFPEIEVASVPGTTAAGAATTGTVYFGTERSRQANELFTETDKAKAVGTYYLDRHTITFGVDTEVSKFENLFAQDVFGRIRFTGSSGYTNFLNPAFGIGGSISRPAQVAGTSLVADSDYTVTGLFLQDKWEVNDRLEVVYGIRYDMMGVDDKPFVNTLFNTTFTSYDGRSGWDNAKTIDGTSSFGPRVGFRYDLDGEKTTLVRGGVGLFQGKVPGVYISNAYSNTGVTQGSISYAATTTLDQYVAQFDPANPIATVPSASSSAANINTIDRDFELPSVWRANLAIDRKVGDWIASLELIRTDVEQGVYVENVNLRPTGTAPDGRVLYAGNLSTAANRFNQSFINVYNMRNTKGGSATNLVVSMSRPMKNNWWMNASYTWTDSTDVSSVTSSTASSNFNNRAVFNQNEDVEARSNYEFRHRILINGGYGFELVEGWKSRVGLTYEGRSGRPFSWVFRDDFNRDGVSFNDLFYVPTGRSDPKIGFASGTTQAQIDSFFSFLETNGLNAYAGGVPPRNSEISSFMHRFDLNFTQTIPLRGRVKMELFANIINVGNLIDDSWGLVSEVPFAFTAGVASGTVTNNQIIYNLATAPQGESINANRSQWAIQVGATLKF